MITVWGRKTSSNVAKVRWLLHELGTPYSLREIGGKVAPLQTLEYLKLNPNAQIPTIVDDGLVLWESNAIIRYLAAKYGSGSIWAEDPKQRAIADKWMDWASLTFAGAMKPYRTALSENSESPKIAGLATKLSAVASVLDSSLANSKFVGGESLTIADFALAPHVLRWHLFTIPRNKHPHLQRYFDTISTLEGFQQCVAEPLG